MVNLSLHFSSLIGNVSLLFGFADLSVIGRVSANLKQRLLLFSNLKQRFYLLQSLPIILLVCSLILWSNGWQLDPILQFAQSLSVELLVYLALKELWGLFNQQRV